MVLIGITNFFGFEIYFAFSIRNVISEFLYSEIYFLEKYEDIFLFP